MRVLIWTDMEGPSGIDSREMLDDKELYKTAKKYATNDVNATIRGVRKANPNMQIDIFDGHGMGGNLLIEKLEPNCKYLGGGWMTTFYDMVDSGELSKYSAVLLLGQHAGEGTMDGFISHTNTGSTQLSVNGQFVGEAPQVAWLFGHFGVPTPLVVGDDAVCREVNVLLPGVKSVAVKKSMDRSTAKSLPLTEAHSLIEQASFEVISQLTDYSPFLVDLPVTIEVSYFLDELATIHAKYPRTTRVSNNSVSYTADNYLEVWLAYNITRSIITQYIHSNFLNNLIELDLDGVKEKLHEFRSEIGKKLKNHYPFSSVKY